ncbi:TonB-dependent receptor plug domain-containing protein [Helicobacter marmotae]|uniref:TonB-dependent receptor plug domain-containing protein n=1 Tax=Helicobacter marmotae TaxID=152490 RepID=UPI0013150F72|nr:TonB-dependent receptor plug domain-containing protein [Helicobacter marmotae]
MSDLETYQSGESLSESFISSNPTGNGDITSILRVLPNVQFDNAQNRSTTPGEIDPANISISGGLFYQNNFMLDGFNMNNDLNTHGGSDSNNLVGMPNSRSQGFNIDTSLLDSISVQDSNISAAYGGFTGGVVEANIRKPRSDGWHGSISYQHTSNHLTHYFIHPSAEAAFATSSDESYQPEFSKHLVKANVEGYITQNLGIIGAFSTTRSYIPLQAYNISRFNGGTELNDTKEQKRISDNYYLKAHYNPTENFTLEANLGYMPQFNTYYNNLARDSFNTIQSGGTQAGLKAIWEGNEATWTNTLGYSRLENSRKSESNFYRWWYANSVDKNWVVPTTQTGYIYEGGYGDIEQLQNTLNFKSDLKFESIDIWRTAHTFRLGAEINYQNIKQNRLGNTYSANGAPQRLASSASITNCTLDSFGLDTCSLVPFTQGSTTYNGQYMNGLVVYSGGEVKLDSTSYGIYLEDDIKFDLGGFGEVNTRLGLRLDGDDYMDKHTSAPRFSLNYITPTAQSYKSTFIFGANRYYGRNLFSYRLYDSTLSQQQRYTRTLNTQTNTLSDWTLNTAYTSTKGTRFNQLNVPYDDEIMLGLSQNLWLFNATLKYIHREGRDEITRRARSTRNNNAPALSGYSTSYNFYTNDGSSRSDIITFMLSNTAPINTFGLKHYYLLAFDWTNTKRTYNPFSSDEAYIENEDIMYNGEIIKYRDRPTDNYTRPYTLRLNTTHTFSLGRTKWLWNNFFRYRAGYERMVLLSRNSAGYDSSFSGSQYGKMQFSGAFNWDMRVGFEVDVFKGNTLFVNLDVYNVLNKQNLTTTSGSSSLIYVSSTAIPVYEVGRQFWLQVGYKF